MKSITIGDTIINKKGKELVVQNWLPSAGLFVIGKWLLRDKRGTTMQLSTVELTQRGFDLKLKAKIQKEV